METRVAVIGIIVENTESAEKINTKALYSNVMENIDG